MLKFLQLFLIFNLYVVVFVRIAFANDYYVSTRASAALNQSDEGALAWSSAVNIDTPCSAGTAMVHAIAGDTVYFRGGTYALEYDITSNGEIFYWYNGALNPYHSGEPGSPITFMAYPGELPIMDVTVDNSWNTGRAFGVTNSNYIIYDGFKAICNGGARVGGIVVMGNNAPGQVVTGNIVKNCIFDGGRDIVTSTDNVEPLRVEHTDGTWLNNNIIYNVRQVNNWHNTSAMKFYHNTNLTISNNEIYNTSCGIFLKSDNDNVRIYNNYIHDNYMGGMLALFLEMSSDNVAIYNNVFAKNSFCSFSVDSEETTAHSYNMLIYNNTYYNSPRGASYGYSVSGGAVGAKIYNNIFYLVGSAETITGKGNESNINQADHNQLGTSFKIVTHLYGSQQGTYTSLPAWQSSGELEGGGNPGAGSLTSDPLFLNASGNMNQVDDFRLTSNSPCRGAGRDGVDMGANIDLVGIQVRAGGGNPPPQRPSSVQGFQLE